MPFCHMCGKELPEGMKFCSGCGTKIDGPVAENTAPAEVAAQPVEPAPVAAPQSQPVQNQQYAPQPQPVQNQQYAPQPQPMQNQQFAPQGAMPPQGMPQAQPKQKKKMPLGLIIGIAGGGAALIAGIVFLVYFFVLRPVTIDLNRFTTIETEGYNTKGKATLNFDYDAFEAEYGEKIRKKNKRRNQNLTQTLFGSVSGSGDPVRDLYDETVRYSFSKDTGLSNGEEITLTWECNDEIAKKDYKCKLKHVDILATVEGLKDAQIVNPFDEIDLAFHGVAPYAYAEVVRDWNHDWENYINVRLDKDTNLEKGDTINATIDNYMGEDWMLENYGIVLDPLQKQFTVDNVGYYVTNINDIPADLNTKVIDRTKQQYVEDFNDDEELVTNVECIGCYFFVNKTDSSDNELYYVYEVNAKDKKGNDYVFYSAQTYWDVKIDENGECSIDPESTNFVGPYNYPANTKFWYRGYETFEDFYKEQVDGREDSYNVFDTVGIEVEIEEEEIEGEDSEEEM